MKLQQAVAAIALRESGMQYADIARRLDVPLGTVAAWIARGAPEVPTACAGCGGALPERKGNGRFPKWCSSRCRKASYGDPCIDCGTRTAFGAERARVPDPRCLSCGQRKRQADEYRPRWDRMAQLYRDGLSYKEIAAEIGLPPHEIGRYITGLRHLGYELPYRYPGVAERHAA